MSQLNCDGMPRQIVRPLGMHERIPEFSTAELLCQTVSPIPAAEPEKPLINRDKYMHLKKQGDTNREISRKRFAPYLEKIRAMLNEGYTKTQIAKETGFNRNTLCGFILANQDLFK